MTETEMKDLTIHTLRGDIQQIGMETNYNERGISDILRKRYLNELAPLEFEDILNEEYAKVEAWRAKQN